MLIEEELSPAGGDLQRHRLHSLDVFRGLALVALLLASVNRDWQNSVAEAFPDSELADFLAFQAGHIPWRGGTLWDLLQPSFLFIAGVAITWSCNRRALFGQRYRAMFLHAAGRSLILIFLGIFLESTSAESTRWTFVNPLTQIGLGYVFLFLLWDRGWRVQGITAMGILFFYWLRFAMGSPPGPEFDWSIAEGEGWKEPLTGFAAHWNKNANPAHGFDVAFLNRFPRSEPFLAHPGGYQTLNFIPSLVVMIFGLMAGEFVRTCGRNWEVVKLLSIAGATGLLVAVILDASGLCPLVKRIWTPSFVLYSTGWCLLIFTAAYGVIDMLKLRKPFLPLTILGTNSITVFLLIWLVAPWLNHTLKIHLGQNYGAFLFGESLQPLMENLIAGAMIWGIAWLMYRRKWFLRI